MPFPPPGDLPDPGIEPAPPGLPGGVFTTETPGKPSISLSKRKKYYLHQELGKHFMIVVLSARFVKIIAKGRHFG